jgi:hypothetical protein
MDDWLNQFRRLDKHTPPQPHTPKREKAKADHQDSVLKAFFNGEVLSPVVSLSCQSYKSRSN